MEIVGFSLVRRDERRNLRVWHASAMRGCLTVLALGLVALLLAAWFLPPILARDAVEVALRSSGFTAQTMSIHVSENPPPFLLLGRADQVHVVATGAKVRGLRADSLDVTLAHVDVARRSFASIDGTLSGVSVPQGGGGAFSASEVDISGPTNAAVTTLRLSPADVVAMVLAAYGAAAREVPIGVELLPPSGLTLTFAGRQEAASLAVGSDGSLLMRAGSLSFTLARPEPDLPLQIRTVAVDASGLVVSGVMDARSLLP